MLKSTARAMCKTATGHAADDQITDPEWNRWLDIEHKLFRRELQKAVPGLYVTVDAQQTISGTDSLTMPTDFEALFRLERQYGSNWSPVDVSDELTPHLGSLTFREEGSTLKVDPIQVAPGVYRILYIAKTADLNELNTPDEDLLVPVGCEDVILERVAARARVNQEEDPTPHLNRATQVWADQRRALKRRYGRHPVPGLRKTWSTYY